MYFLYHFHLLRDLSLEDMVGLLSCVQHLFLPDKSDRYVYVILVVL